jgi:carboxypeptidase Taq
MIQKRRFNTQKLSRSLTKITMESFLRYLGEIQDLNSAQGLLGWDMETMMPPQGAALRSKQLSTLAKLSHNMMTSETMQHHLETLGNQDLSTLDRAIVLQIKQDVEKALKIPTRLVQALSEATSEAHLFWMQAREDNHYALFAPHLERIIGLNQEMAEALGYLENPYDALLDEYEPDLTVKQLDPMFAQLKSFLIPLIQELASESATTLTGFFPLESQKLLNRKILTAIGFNFEAGRLDEAPHPFSMGLGPQDVRLTTRYDETDVLSALYSSIHEAGHGMYEQGVNPYLARTPLNGGASLGIHESQSRLWENMVARSLPFWEYFYPLLQESFPEALDEVLLADFYKQSNRVQPSLIRVESDEVTYNLHIILRYELEKELISGTLRVKDLPEAWGAKTESYFGLRPGTDSEGCLQDIHWSHGSFGYFPTYTLGNLYAAQFFNTAEKTLGSQALAFSKGDFQPLKSWLNQQIHWSSRSETPTQIVQRVTGESLNSQYFMNYLRTKYTRQVEKV